MLRLLAHRSALVAALVVAIATAPLRTAAAPQEQAQPLLDTPEAQALLDEGLEHFYAEDFDAAAKAFADAYAVEPAGFLLYSWAQAERYAERCNKAITLFERFLATTPPDEEAAKARKSILECGGIPPSESPTPPPPARIEPPVESAPASPPRAEPPPPRPPNVGLIVGLSVAGVGALTGAAGAILLANGTRLRDTAPDASTQQAYVDQLDRGDRRQVGGIALVSVGAALLIGGVVTAIVTSRRRR